MRLWMPVQRDPNPPSVLVKEVQHDLYHVTLVSRLVDLQMTFDLFFLMHII